MSRRGMNATLLGLGWMVSLGVVFVLGILSAFAFHLGPGAGDSSGSRLNLDQRQLLLVVERYSGQSRDLAALVEVGSGEAVPDQLEQTIRGILRVGDPVQRREAAGQLVDGLPSRRVMAVIRFLQEIPGGPGRDDVLATFLESWAEEDGRRAIVFASSLARVPERELAIQSVLRGWSHSEPAEAWQWVIDQGGATRRAERWLAVIVSSLSSSNRPIAFQLLEQMPPSTFQNQMSQVVMQQILEAQAPREAIDWLGEFPVDSSFAAAVLLAETWARTEPATAAQWITGSYPGQTGGLSGIIREWVYIQPEEAADWVFDGFSGIARRELLEFISEEWIANDGPGPLANWINTRGPHSSLDGAIGQLALFAANLDPATAMDWAHSVYDEDSKSMLEIVIGRLWIRMNPEDAANQLPPMLLSESARAALLEPEPEPEPLLIYEDPDGFAPEEEGPPIQ